MVKAFGEVWTFLALQEGFGVTGQRFRLFELAEFLKKYGEEEAIAKWRGKLTEAIYTPYTWPKKVHYQTPGSVYKMFEFEL